MGREIARRLVARGYEVIVTDIDLEGARETAELLGGRTRPMALDVRDPAAHRAAAAAAADRGRLKSGSTTPASSAPKRPGSTRMKKFG